MTTIQPLDLKNYSQIVIVTGAGVSVASGLSPYRGPGGLWESSDSPLPDRDLLQRDPATLWRIFAAMRQQARGAQPNAAHRAIAQAQEVWGTSRLVLLTQNIDNLHQRAGSHKTIELHGSLFRARCSDDECRLLPFALGEEYDNDSLPTCPQCQAPLRPDVVLFGEPLPPLEEWQAKQALRNCDLFLAVGTSGSVSPVSNFVRSAQYAGAQTLLVNLQTMDPPNPYFQQEIIGPAETLLPALLT